MEIVRRRDPKYAQARIISNARFDYEPDAIYFCESPEDVATAIAAAKPKFLRMRSGGHHHEGMCSGQDVLMLDISRLDTIFINGEVAAIGPGAKLKNVYDAAATEKVLFPGGGCGDVRVGGLVQGGGWGPYARMLGLTCDSLQSFDIVTLDGMIKDVSPANHPKLFWAVSGGGGGNFGVVTQFRFRLQRQQTELNPFTITWKDRALVPAVIQDWMKNFPHADNRRLTTFCRLGTGDDAPALIGGTFLGDRITCARVLKEQLPNTFSFGELTYPAGVGRRVEIHPEYQPGAPGDTPNLGDTCAGNPFPHKVSSCFPSDAFGADALNIIVERLGRTGAVNNARLYLSLHSLGGAIDDLSREKTSCFPYRRKPFMLQYQAWWWDMSRSPITKACMNWVAMFRDALRDRYTEGAFINFPDQDLAGPDERKKLLRYYYAGNLEELIGVKYQHDPDNVFDFPMGIPPK